MSKADGIVREDFLLLNMKVELGSGGFVGKNYQKQKLGLIYYFVRKWKTKIELGLRRKST